MLATSQALAQSRHRRRARSRRVFIAGSHELDQRIQARLREDGKVIDGKVASGEYVQDARADPRRGSRRLDG